MITDIQLLKINSNYNLVRKFMNEFIYGHLVDSHQINYIFFLKTAIDGFLWRSVLQRTYDLIDFFSGICPMT